MIQLLSRYSPSRPFVFLIRAALVLPQAQLSQLLPHAVLTSLVLTIPQEDQRPYQLNTPARILVAARVIIRMQRRARLHSRCV